tara:strand:+ start:563 stop:817 length:255 start_codon:yes stop_codon:yes gene_type:complete
MSNSRKDSSSTTPLMGKKALHKSIENIKEIARNPDPLFYHPLSPKSPVSPRLAKHPSKYNGITDPLVSDSISNDNSSAHSKPKP